MRISLLELRRIIRRELREAGGGVPTRPPHTGRNPLSPEMNDREQLGFLADKPVDTMDDPEGLPAHLRDPVEDPEDCFGPVPPTNADPYVQQDPFTRDTSPLPTPAIKR